MRFCFHDVSVTKNMFSDFSHFELNLRFVDKDFLVANSSDHVSGLRCIAEATIFT